MVFTKERWGKQTTPETEGRLGELSWAEDLTADESGRLQGYCLVSTSDFFAFFFPFLSQLQQGLLDLRLPGRFTPSTPLHPDRNIAYTESSLIASSTSRHLAMPSTLKKWLDFIIFNLSNSFRVILFTTLRIFNTLSTKLFHITDYDSSQLY